MGYIKVYNECLRCSGLGKEACEACDGRGTLEDVVDMLDTTPCPFCHYDGQINCPNCDGWGIIEKEEYVSDDEELA